MAYGTIKVDNITFDNGGVDKLITVSGLFYSTSGALTVTGTISGGNVTAPTATFTTLTGTATAGTTATFTSGSFTSLTGVTTTGTTANFVSGVFTTQISGATITGTTVAATTGNYTSLTGVTTTGTTANFVSGVFTTRISGATITGTTVATTTGSFVSLTGTTATFTSGIIASGTAALPSLAILSDLNTGIYSPGADQLAISTSGTGRVFVTSAGNVGIGTSSPGSNLAIRSNRAVNTYAFSVGTTNGASFENDVVFGFDGSTQYIGNFQNFSLAFGTNNTERLRITSAGLVGIGTSVPVNLLDVEGGIGVNYANGLRSVRDQYTTNNIIIRHQFVSPNDQLELTPIGNSATSAIALRTASASTVATRMFIGPTGLVGIGTTSPATSLDVQGSVRVRDGNGFQWNGTSAATDTKIWDAYADNTTANTLRFRCLNDAFSTGNTWLQVNRTGAESTAIILSIGTSERARIDSSGRLLVGTSSNWAVAAGTGASLQIASTIGASIRRTSEDTSPPNLSFAKARGTVDGSFSIVQLNDNLGEIRFAGFDGSTLVSQGASISAFADGTPGVNDMPGRLVFSTTADGASSPTERMRITSAGVLQIAEAGNITVGTTTGTKIGTATTQKIGFYNATPVVQPAAVANATTAVDVITQLNDLLAKLRTLGIIAT